MNLVQLAGWLFIIILLLLLWRAISPESYQANGGATIDKMLRPETKVGELIPAQSVLETIKGAS